MVYDLLEHWGLQIDGYSFATEFRCFDAAKSFRSESCAVGVAGSGLPSILHSVREFFKLWSEFKIDFAVSDRVECGHGLCVLSQGMMLPVFVLGASLEPHSETPHLPLAGRNQERHQPQARTSQTPCSRLQIPNHKILNPRPLNP